ncbi:hypothetical protein Tco_0496069 [Tanacetum coccineum]
MHPWHLVPIDLLKTLLKTSTKLLVNSEAVENVVENESHFSLEVVDQDLSPLAMFTKHLMSEQGKRVVRVGEGKVEFMGGIGGGSFANVQWFARMVRIGDGFVVDCGEDPHKHFE